MANKISGKKIGLFVVWFMILMFLVFGFLLPMMRIPVMGMVHFHEVRGGSKLASWLIVGGFAMGGALALFLQARSAVVAGISVAGAALSLLAVCLIRLSLYLNEKLSMLSTDGIDLSRVVQKGGIFLFLAFFLGVFWLIFYGVAKGRKHV